MRKKLISKTYLRDVNKYELKVYFDNDDYYLSTKRIIDIKEPFILSTGLCVIDKGYYIVEVIPKNENYAMRVYFNDKKERVEYYFDISLQNGLDEDTLIPYYDDLYTDITIENGKVEVLDEEELKDALDKGKITKSDFELANNARDELLKSIQKNNNKYMNIDLEGYLT